MKSKKVTKTQAREVAFKIFGHNKAKETEDSESFYSFTCGIMKVLIEKYYGELSGEKHPNGCIMIDTISAPFSVVDGNVEINWAIDDILPRARFIAMYLTESVDNVGKIEDKDGLIKARAAALDFYKKY